jgi:hypothetical protein
MDTLLDDAVDKEGGIDLTPTQQPKPSTASLPHSPSREQVTQAVSVLIPAIRGCAMGQAGTAVADIVVANDGRVSSARISGAPFAGTSSGRCMEGVLRRGKFPAFRKPTLRVKYPIEIQ